MARMEKQSYTFFTGGDKNTGGPASVNGGTEVVATGIAVGCEHLEIPRLRISPA